MYLTQYCVFYLTLFTYKYVFIIPIFKCQIGFLVMSDALRPYVL